MFPLLVLTGVGAAGIVLILLTDTMMRFLNPHRWRQRAAVVVVVVVAGVAVVA